MVNTNSKSNSSIKSIKNSKKTHLNGQPNQIIKQQNRDYKELLKNTVQNNTNDTYKKERKHIKIHLLIL